MQQALKDQLKPFITRGRGRYFGVTIPSPDAIDPNSVDVADRLAGLLIQNFGSETPDEDSTKLWTDTPIYKRVHEALLRVHDTGMGIDMTRTADGNRTLRLHNGPTHDAQKEACRELAKRVYERDEATLRQQHMYEARGQAEYTVPGQRGALCV